MAICINCYSGTNINKFVIHLASLLTIPDINYLNNHLEEVEIMKNWLYKNLTNIELEKINNPIYAFNTYTCLTTYEQIKNIKFNSINEVIKYLLKHNFKSITSNSIHVAFYCDGVSGYKYKDLKEKI